MEAARPKHKARAKKRSSREGKSKTRGPRTEDPPSEVLVGAEPATQEDPDLGGVKEDSTRRLCAPVKSRIEEEEDEEEKGGGGVMKGASGGEVEGGVEEVEKGASGGKVEGGGEEVDKGTSGVEVEGGGEEVDKGTSGVEVEGGGEEVGKGASGGEVEGGVEELEKGGSSEEVEGRGEEVGKGGSGGEVECEDEEVGSERQVVCAGLIEGCALTLPSDITNTASLAPIEVPTESGNVQSLCDEERTDPVAEVAQERPPLQQGGLVMEQDLPGVSLEESVMERDSVASRHPLAAHVAMATATSGRQQSTSGVELNVSTSQATVSAIKSSAPALLDFSETVQLVQRESPAAMTTTVDAAPLYPKLDSITAEQEVEEEMEPFSEDGLAQLYSNPQLESNPTFVDNFIMSSNQERHELYELLMQYLKARTALITTTKHVQALQNQYSTHQPLQWEVETREITSTGKCRDNHKVSHSHSHKFAVFHPEAAIQVHDSLRRMREVIYEVVCMKSYSTQLARIHVENYIYQLISSTPELQHVPENGPVTSWVPNVPPGYMDVHTSSLRDCISVLFTFERRPSRDLDFSKDCRQWLDLLLSCLLRISSLSDHQFIFNHLLRSPSGVSQWASGYVQIASPLHTAQLIQMQYQGGAVELGYGHHWGVVRALSEGWGGPLLDHFITMLATLLLPIKERENFLAQLSSVAPQRQINRETSQPWTFVEEDLEEDDDEEHQLLLKESDYIAFFDQFPFTEVFRYILVVPDEGEYIAEHITSHTILRLIAFCSCLMRLLGAAFSTLRLSRYREFIKRVGRTVRLTVQYVADHWLMYKSHRLQNGDSMSSLPQEEGGRASAEGRYSLNRLQLEFDEFVLRGTQWILTAHKLGAWQFLADMPYVSVSLSAIWKIFYTLYCTQSRAKSGSQGCDDDGSLTNLEGQRLSTAEEIIAAVQNEYTKAQFVDSLMHTLSSEAVFLLTTFVNMARSCSAESREEMHFINTIAVVIFECTQVTEFARDAYSRTGHSLLDSIAIVHPFILTTLMEKVEGAVGCVGENCILLFKQLPLHLWTPTSQDLLLMRQWLVRCPLGTHENMLACVILSGLNWGTKAEDGSAELVLDWSLHRYVAFMLSEAHSHHLPSHPGGRDYSPAPSGLSKYTSSLQRFTMSVEESEFVSWAWEVALMLKLHPNQVLLHSMQTLSPTPQQSGTSSSRSHDHSGDNDIDRSEPALIFFSSDSATPDSSQRTSSVSHTGTRSGNSESRHSPEAGPRVGEGGAKDPSVYSQHQSIWHHKSPSSEEIVLPDLAGCGERELVELRDAVGNEGHLASYIALCLTSVGSDTDHFIRNGVVMLHRLIDQGYYLPALRVLANITPRLFKHKKIVMEESGFVQLVLAIASADATNSSLKDRILLATPVPLVLRKMAALMQMQVQSECAPGGVGGEMVLQFWMEVLLAQPNWLRERSSLYLLDALSVAAFSEQHWQKVVQQSLLEEYRALKPLAAAGSRSLFASVFNSLVSHDGGIPSIFNSISVADYPWLAYNALCAEESYEEEEGVWKGLLAQLKADPKTSIDTALKRALSELKLPSSAFPSLHLSIYRWGEFCTSLDHSHPLVPLPWQRFFSLYLRRPVLNSSVPERESFGLRFLSSSRGITLQKKMKSTLASTCKELQNRMDTLSTDEGGEMGEVLRTTLGTFLPKCLSFFKMLRLWLEEPRLHDGALYLPGLPPQYDHNRLSTVFQHRQAQPWLEFVPLWEVKGHVNSLVEEWVQVAAYQRSLPSKTPTPESSPESATTRIQKRLRKRGGQVAPPPFQLHRAPFSPLPSEVLLCEEALLSVIRANIQYIADEAGAFCAKNTAIRDLDAEYCSAISELHSNEPRQFHVRVPCHSRFNRSHQCNGPATIVFRFDELTVHPKWEQRLKDNRAEYGELLTTLLSPISQHFCSIVMMMENTVAELSRLSAGFSQSDEMNIALQCGIALFYAILEFVTLDTRQYPPSCQFLTSCVHILGQEFIQRDPRQTSHILDMLLAQRARADLLAPLFQPNSCPDQFLQMYGTTAEVAVKEGPDIAFSVLTKFSVMSWLEFSSPNQSDCDQLLNYISQGLTLCGLKPTPDCAALIEMYRNHFQTVLGHRFPDHYSNALWLVVTATDSGAIIPESWKDISQSVSSSESPEQCRLGLQEIQDSLRLLSRHYLERRTSSAQSLYSLLQPDYVPLVGQLLQQLAQGAVNKWAESVVVAASSQHTAVMESWHGIVDVFVPWITTLQYGTANGQSSQHHPCSPGEVTAMATLLKNFIASITAAHMQLKDPTENVSILSLLWHYYCTSLALPGTPKHIMMAYHTSLTRLPWREFLPDLVALDSMMKLKLSEHTPPSSFVFLGSIFPQFHWKTIVTVYCTLPSEEPEAPVQLHIMLLQLLVMLAAEKEVMEATDTRIPDLMEEAQDYRWEYIDTKTFNDILQWLKMHCDPAMVLQTGSSLSLSLRLLKAAAGFPSSTGVREPHHTDTWEKRLLFTQAVVEFICTASHHHEAHNHSYSDAISQLYQLAIDICIHEPQELHTGNVGLLMQEILNLLNSCSTTDSIVIKIMELTSDLLDQMPNGYFLALPTITAGCRSLASLPCMSKVVERAIECHFHAMPKPDVALLELPQDHNQYGWLGVTASMTVPENSMEEFFEICIGDCAALILNANLMQTLPQSTSLEQELRIAVKLVQWCTQMKPKSSQEAKVFLLWEKTLHLLLRQLRFGSSYANTIPHFTCLAATLARYGEDKATEGILGVIGLGRKSSYSHEFRMISRAMAAFLYCQMPVDRSQTTNLRVVPNDSGHIRDSPKYQQGGSAQLSHILPTKLGEQTYASLESLLNNKHYSHLKEQVSYAVSFINDSTKSIMSSPQLLVFLCTSLFPDCRFLDLLRVLS